MAELVRRGANVSCRDLEGSAPGEVFEAEVDPATQRQIQVRHARDIEDRYTHRKTRRNTAHNSPVCHGSCMAPSITQNEWSEGGRWKGPLKVEQANGG